MAAHDPLPQAAGPGGALPAFEASIPLPPPAPAPRGPAHEPARGRLRFDLFLLLLILILAFFVGSFTVRNSDFWMHLATGRALATGAIRPGDEPFSYTAPGPWINHSWLYGLALYHGHALLGGPPLVLLKGLLVAALALMLLASSRLSDRWWTAAACSMLALLAMIPRLLFQPTLASFFLLALFVLLLARDDRRRHAARAGGSPAGPGLLWLTVPLTALWVNLDAWYFLGPLTLLLWVLGNLLQDLLSSRAAAARSGRPAAPRSGAAPRLAVVVLAALACLASPWLLRGLTLPAELAATDVIARLQADEFFRRIYQSPWDPAYMDRDAWTLGGAAFYLLIVLGAVSFVLNFSSLRLARLFLWLTFFALASWYARAIPFFAIVAGPVTAWNLQDWLARRAAACAAARTAARAAARDPVLDDRPARTSPLVRLGHALLVLAGLALVALAWPGWLMGFQQDSRRVAWALDPDGSAVHAADRLAEWRSQNRLPGNVFNLTPDLANFFAWFVPPEAGVQGFFDYRIDLYDPATAEDYVKVRKDLGARGDTRSATEPAWPRVFRDHGVTVLAAHDNDVGRLGATLNRLLANPLRWDLLDLGGHTLLARVIDPPRVPPANPLLDHLRGMPGYENYAVPRSALGAAGTPSTPHGGPPVPTYDPAVAAFGPRAEPLPPIAPHWPSPRVVGADWEREWINYAHGPGTRSPAADAAFLNLILFDTSAADWRYRTFLVPWMDLLAGALVGPPADGTPAGVLGTALRTRAALSAPPPTLDEGDPAPLYLAIRDARQAILTNPRDAVAYYRLGQAYRGLRFHTAERRWGASLPWLHLIRQVQAASAFRQSIAWQPNYEPALVALAELFSQMGYLDLAARYRADHLQAAAKAGPLPGETAKSFAQRMEAAEKDLRDLEKLVKTRENELAVKSSGKKTVDRALIAFNLGLADKALDIIGQARPEELTPEGQRLALDLLATTGRLADLRDNLVPPGHPEQEQTVADNLRAQGGSLYEYFRVLAAASEGDYPTASRFLAEAGRRYAQALAKATPVPGPDKPDKPGEPAPAPDEDPVATWRRLTAFAVGGYLLDAVPRPAPVVWLMLSRVIRDQKLADVGNLAIPLMQEADMTTLRGVMALEAGDVAAAETHFREALFRGDPHNRHWHDFGGLGVAAGYLERLEQAADAAKPPPP